MTEPSQKSPWSPVPHAASALPWLNAFLADGWRVVLLDIEARLLGKSVTALANPDATLAVTCDVSDPNAVAAAFARIEHHFGRLDALVNNAGVAVFLPLMETSDADWSRVLAVNLTEPLCARRLLCR